MMKTNRQLIFLIISSRFYEMDEIRSMKGDNIRKIVPFVRQITEEGKPKLEVYRPTTNPIYIYTQVSLIALIKHLFS